MSAKRGPPAHQNTVQWVAARNDKHNSLRKLVSELPNSGVCDKCHKQIEWKKQYGKYKPLKQPAKCVGCGERAVTDAYHTLCRQCAFGQGVCAKCQSAAPLHQKQADEAHPRERLPDASELAEMSERERRTALRKVAKAKKERKAAEAAAKEAAAGGSAAPSADREEVQSDEEEDELEAAEEQAPARDVLSVAAAAARRKAAAVNDRPPPEQPLQQQRSSQAALPAGPAEQAYAHLASVGHVPAVGGKADASSEACWSDRDLAGRTPTDSVGGGDDDEMMDEDAAAVAAVEAEAATDDDDDDDDDDDAEGDESGEEGEASALGSDDNEEVAEGQDVDGEELRERLECLGHSAGARALVMQCYGWLRPAEHLSIAEAGFDGLCERLTDAGGAEAKAADAMTDRIAHIAETADDAAMTLAMLLELECYASALPASFAADATDAEHACRRLVALRGASA